ncbi:MAG: phosphoadenosine phosphosulfate reductase family protein [Thermoplasmata archaeon]|nr:phosphoadenosine phosphosulfate reductase family protein [Thermoplasmata archaeon]
MGLVRFGPLVLRWCLSCNIPVVEQKECSICGATTVEVPVTPPGDVKPGFTRELRMFRQILDRQFGKGCGTALFPKNKVVVLNPVPSIDKMYEIILDGQVVGAVRYDIKKGWQMLLRMEGAFRIAKFLTKNYVVADEGAVAPILNGSNLMAVGVVEAEETIEEGDEVIVLDNLRRPLAVGVAKMDAQEMLKITEGEKRGVAVKVRWKEGWREPRILKDTITGWKRIAEGSRGVLAKREEMAVNFIKSVVGKYNKPVAVSFSGGKDSMVTLLLVLKAGLKPKILFVDTGLELPETVEYVKQTAGKFNLELLVDTAGNSFWENLELFGPPGRDFRWCCKLCKLGPTARLIANNFPGGAVVFIGQRVYESEQRAQKGSVWDNPWVPGQIGASPVQYWNALHIWLYIMLSGVEINPWYAEGMERIGCYLCPASSIGDFYIIRKKFREFEKWEKYLKDYALRHNLPAEFLKYGLWRWRKLPPGIKEYIGGVEVRQVEKGIELRLADSYSPCVGGYRIEGVYNTKFELARIENLLNIIGIPKCQEGMCEIDFAQVFAEGAIAVKGKDEQEMRGNLEKLHAVIMKAVSCVRCGICASRCPQGAITVDEKGIKIDAGKCGHCGTCLQPCPAVVYRQDTEVW